ncbi:MULTISPECIES: relaxase/mobilization nuclease [Streptomyces]|uniref:relaxase/mobilization nuclease n=1 Tax=Streptomyces TaxID=1883 RepID=UPI002248F56B|nr:relaxase/mobilization nuclease [Streptomyces sp. JHD 1]MCX2969463.1 relaxase/mobilization nuclease [Streptomyces sp. JHD 1]
MIPRVNERSIAAHEPLGDALARPVSTDEALTEHTVVAHWPGLDFYTLDDEQALWTSAQWSEHLDDPLFEHPFAASAHGDRRAILHLDARLHPDDRDLNGAQWAEVGHRLARAAGIEIPGDEAGCRWIAVQAQPGRIDVIANLIRLDGTWQQQPADLLRRHCDEARRIEQDLHLIPVRIPPEPQIVAARPVPTASAQLAMVLSQLADEQAGSLAAVRGLVEHAAHRIALQSRAAGDDTAHSLGLIARRLYRIQQDLDATATRLTGPPGVPPAPSAVRHTTRRSL